ncbi:hypothetical protein CASFOL_030840 [Castilleja foliolosa]|uniref:Poly [ADP-ribose] polymerase n=1 Tax=Castilleja foliolosa TaxID=1961234 RepID=A0ABD3C6H3_9LAMI
MDGKKLESQHSMGPTQSESEMSRTNALESLPLIDDLLHKLEDPIPSSQDDHDHNPISNERKSCINIPNGFNRIPDGDSVSEFIKNNLESSLSAYGLDARVESIYKNVFSSVMGQVRLRCFNMYTAAVEKHCSGNANVKHAWYGASKKAIEDILRFGFGYGSNNGVGKGIYLSEIDHAIESMQQAPADEDGVRYMLVCRVILGNMEVISPFPGQNEPSSLAFDSGVDNNLYPKKYILWATRMNTHILPDYVVTFRTTDRGSMRDLQPSKAANASAPWAATYEALSRFLNADELKFVSDQYDNYKKHRITKYELVRSLRGVVEDELSVRLIKDPTEKDQNDDASNPIANSPQQNRSGGTTSMTPITILDTSLSMLPTPTDHPPTSIIYTHSLPSLQQGLFSNPRPTFISPSSSSRPNLPLPHDSQIADSNNKGKKPMFDF